MQGIIDGKIYSHKLPSIDDIIKCLNDDPNRNIMFSEDISRAYRNFGTEISSWPLNVSVWRGKFYIDCSMAFGSRLSSLNMTRVANKIVEILREENILSFMYLDDIICLNHTFEEAERNQARVRQLLDELGLPTAKDKSTTPSQVIKWLGVHIDSVKNLLYVPTAKLNDIVLFSNRLTVRRTISKKQLQSILGRTFYVGKCIRPVRAFTSRLLETLRKNPTEQRIQVSEEMCRDILWFKNFASTWNGITLIPKLNEIQTIYVHNDKYLCYASDGKLSYELKLEVGALDGLLISAINIWAALETFSSIHPGIKLRFIASNRKIAEVFTLANSRTESLNEIARIFWLSKAHANCECYFGFKLLHKAQGESSSSFIDSAFNTPRIKLDHILLNKIYNFINRYKI